MRRKILALTLAMLLVLLAGCAAAEPAPETVAATVPVQTTQPTAEETTQATAEAAEPAAAVLPDGVYTAEFDTDSSMFHVNEAYEGKGILTVQDGAMTIHVTLAGTKILNLFPGTAEQAQLDGAQWLQPSEDEVTYSDGYVDMAFGFDIPVPYLDEEFDCALIGTKGVWYDHKVSVSNPQPMNAEGFTCEVTLSGGSGKAHVESPCPITKEDGQYWAVIIWSSKNYEYMLLDGVQYDPIQAEGENSTFKIPVTPDQEVPVSAMNVAMSEPHLIEYTLFFDSATLTK